MYSEKFSLFIESYFIINLLASLYNKSFIGIIKSY